MSYVRSGTKRNEVRLSPLRAGQCSAVQSESAATRVVSCELN